MIFEILRSKRNSFLLNLLFLLILLPLAGCALFDLDLNTFEAVQIKKPNGDLAWSKVVYVNHGGKRLIFPVESTKLEKILNPEDPSLKDLQINLVPVTISFFGQWKTPDGSKFILSSSVQYDKNQDVFLLANPILSTTDGSEKFLLTADLSNGEHVTVNVTSGAEIKNNPKIDINGGIKK